MPSITRQTPLLRRCVGPDQTVLVAARCHRLGRHLSSEYLLLLTRERLVVTTEGRLFHWPRLHLDALIGDLKNVAWSPEPRLASIELACTAPDGIRERFLIKVRTAAKVWHFEAALSYVFRPAGTAHRRLAAAAVLPAAL